MTLAKTKVQTVKTQYSNLTSEQWGIISRATSGTFHGQYWTDRAIADVYEKTGVRLEGFEWHPDLPGRYKLKLTPGKEAA